jgi:hypothetical protein
MTKTSKKEKKRSLTMRGRVEYKRKVEGRKTRSARALSIDFTKLQRTYLKRNDLLNPGCPLSKIFCSIYDIVHHGKEFSMTSHSLLIRQFSRFEK